MVRRTQHGQYNTTVTRVHSLQLAALASLLTIALLVVAGTPPGYPVNDAAAYHRMVELWAEHGQPLFIGWNEMTLLGHLLVGVAAHHLGAASITARQLLVGAEAALVSALLVLFLARRGGTGLPCLATALTWLASPLVVVSATCFMTEIPVTVASVCWLLAFAAWVSSPRAGTACAWVMAAVLAFSIRQTGIVLPLAAAFTAPVMPDRRRPHVVAFASLVIALDGLLYWYRSTLPLATIRPLSSFWSSTSLLTTAATSLVHCAQASVTIALWLAPLTVLLVWRQRGRAVALPGVAAAGVAGILCALGGSTFPFWRNITTHQGLLPDTLPHHGALAPLAPSALWLLLTVLGLVSLAVLFTALLGRDVYKEPITLALAASCLGFLLLAALPTTPWDRYLVPVLPLSVALLGSGRTDRARWRPPAVLLLATLCLCSAWCVRQLHRRQLAVWAIAEQVVATGVDPRRVDGGFEWNLWHQEAPFDPAQRRPPAAVLTWYESYPFTRLEPLRRLWIGSPPSGWHQLEQHTIPGGYRVSILAPDPVRSVPPGKQSE